LHSLPFPFPTHYWYIKFLMSVLKDLSGLPQTYREFSLSAGSPAPDAASLARVVRGLFADATARGTAQDVFQARLVKAGVEESLAGDLSRVLYSERRKDVLLGALARVGVQLGGRPLVKWDWSVKHVLASSRVSSLGDSLLHLSLTLGPSALGDMPGETVDVELTPKEAQALVDVLEAARAASLAC
jgi:hypothetical protein